LQKGNIRIISSKFGTPEANKIHVQEVARHVLETSVESVESRNSNDDRDALTMLEIEGRKGKESSKESNKESNDEGEKRSTCRKVFSGGVFGCVEFVLGSARQDTALATTYCTVMVLPRTEVWNIVAAAPDLAPDVQHLLANQLDKETPEETPKGVFDGVKLKTQNNFLKKFRKKKKKEEMIEGEAEALKMTEQGNTRVSSFLFSAISKQESSE
jgi:hypothetical protein